MSEPRHTAVTVVGAGFAGLAAVVRLRQQGITDVVVLERADEVGGTWRDNTYPGAACDVPSHLYSYSFAPNPDWSRSFSGQPEIQAYLRDVADRFDVRRHVRFRHEMRSASWDEERAVWTVHTDRGSFTTGALVLATGALSDPKVPDLPGLAEFTGTVFHSARWRHDHDLTGERVAVVGTGASAIQFVPQVQPTVGHLDVYQRTPPWVIPRWDRDVGGVEKAAYRRVPGLQKLVRAGIYWGRETYVLGFTVDTRLMRLAQRLALRHLHRQVRDPRLRAALTPDYTIGCKRILIANDYYPALTQPNVDVVTAGIREVRPRSVVDAAGVERPADTIVFGTGFQVTELPVAARVRGRAGRSLADVWGASPHAYRGTTVPGFPNLFLVVGPNTGLGHNSQVFMIEAQVAYVVDALRTLRDRGLAAVEVRPEAEDAYNRSLQAAMRGTVWTTGGCSSWYLDATGRNSTLWPGATWRFRRLTRRFDLAAYQPVTPSARPAAEPALAAAGTED